MLIELGDRYLDNGYEYNPNLVIVPLPDFFQRNATSLGKQFHFVGPIYNDSKCFKPWISSISSEKTVLVSATTGLPPQPEYFLTVIRAFANTPFRVILSIGDELAPESLAPLPDNFEVNQFSSQQEILQQCCLFICHGGISSVFEALRFGVPILMVPPCQVHNVHVIRTQELGLGLRLRPAEFNPENLRNSAMALLADQALLERVKDVQKTISNTNGAEKAASLIEKYMVG
jgi:MGT family glycosyltransferase